MCTRKPPTASVLSFDVGTRNPGICHIERTGPDPDPHDPPSALRGRFRILHWEVVDLGGKHVPLKEVVANLDVELRARSWGMEVEKVRIEQQPMLGGARRAMVCVRNQTLSHCFYTHYRARGHQDVDYVHPVHKLKVWGRGPVEAKPPTGEKGYARRKEMAVEHTRELLKGCDQWARWFERQAKKDDLADAFLQALHSMFVEV